jgi:membrane protein
MVLMLWLYLSGMAIVIGAELNAEIEHASPHGKAAGEKVPGERKCIGPRAARKFKERQERAEAPRAPAVHRPATPRRAPGLARTGALLSGLVAAMLRRRV